MSEGPGAIPGMDLVKDELLNIHTPVIYILGGESDIAYNNGMDDYKRIEHVPVAVNWLQWQLRNDAEAARNFVGADCILCRDKEWTLERKRID